MAITINDIIKLNVTKDDILGAIQIAKNSNFLDNLRDRHINVQFDSKLRGYIGENAFKKWLDENSIKIDATNIIDDENGMDIDFTFLMNDERKNLELKTSLIPDTDENLTNVIARRDIKIIKRTPNIERLSGDIHVQIYYDQLTRAKDTWLTNQNINIDSDDLEYLFTSFAASRYLEDTYLIGWIDKPTLIAHINSLPLSERTWHHARRDFWVCKFRIITKSMSQLKDYMK